MFCPTLTKFPITGLGNAAGTLDTAYNNDVIICEKWRIAADWGGAPEAGYYSASSADPLVVDGKVKDNRGYGYAFECGYVLSDRIRFAAGLGGVSYKVDMSGTTDDTALSVFVNSRLNVAGNAMVVPEFGYFDRKEDGFGNEQGSAVYVGAKWQIDF